MEDKLTKTVLLDTLQVERSRWQDLLAEVGEARMTEQILATWWSVKDIIAHVAWYEQETAALLQPQTRQFPARDWLWDQPQDKRNAILFKEFRDRPLGAVLADEQQAYLQLVAAVRDTAEKDIRNPAEFPGMLSTWQPWQLIAHHSYEHYRQHEPAIRAWLDTMQPQEPDHTRVLVGATASRP